MEKYFELFYRCNQHFSIDSRTVEPGFLYVAIVGSTFNGNDFIEAALDRGATYCITSEKQKTDKQRVFYVSDTLLFLQKLANYHRNRFSIPVIGITGSNGKTTTKELIVAVLTRKFNVLYTEGNLNNHIGVPLTLLRLNPNHEIAVIEMGANKPGDIEELCNIAEPTYGVITNIGLAHLEGFGSFEGVKQTKLAMYRAMDRNHGKIFINEDDEVLTASIPSPIETITYSMHKSSSVNGKMLASTPFLHFGFSINDEKQIEVRSQLIGSYNLYNFLCAICIGNYFGVSNEAMVAGLEDYTPTNNRSQWKITAKNTLIVDCYNANLTSMKAALSSLESMNAVKALAILGDMLELGDESYNAHYEIIQWCERLKIPLVCIGKEFWNIPSSIEKHQHTDALIQSGRLEAIEGTTILLKGSRGIGLEKIIPFL
ncbi:MAG: UDP-N-acetylmuramoyl-tripeptide--D-alanyl-D-alanine ligase [Flavobacteriales bacterium]